MCILVHKNLVKVCAVQIFNKAICTTFCNRGRSIWQLLTLTWRFVCRRSGCSVKWHGKTDIVGCRSNGSYGVRQETACGERLLDNDLWTHALHWYVPPLSHAHTHPHRSLPRYCLTLSSARWATLAQSCSLYLSLVYTLYTLSRRLSI